MLTERDEHAGRCAGPCRRRPEQRHQTLDGANDRSDPLSDKPARLVAFDGLERRGRLSERGEREAVDDTRQGEGVRRA